MRIAAIIPSRYGSSRFEGKPLAKINGKPMIQHVYERVQKSECLTDIAVATDDQRIHQTVLDFGGSSIITSKECRSGSDRAAEAATKLGLGEEDVVVNVQGDQPLIAPQSVDQVVQPFFEESKINMTTLAFKIIDPIEITNPKDVKVTFDIHGDALYFSRSPIPRARDTGTSHDTYKHLGIYAYTKGFLDIFRNLSEGMLERIEKLEQLRVLEYGYKIRIIISQYDSPEVDLPEDIVRIEKLVQ